MTEDAAPPRRSGLRILLVVFAAGAGLSVLGCAVCAFSGYLWVDRNAESFRESGARIEGEAAAFAASHTQGECVDEGLARDGRCGDPMAIMCHAEARVFVSRCLATAAPTPELCDGVPPPTEIMAGAHWSVAECSRRGHAGDQQCGQLMRAIVEHCAAR